MTTTLSRPTASLFDLASDAIQLDRAINDAAEGLLSDDPAEAAAAAALLEELISAEGQTRQAIEAKADAWCWAIDRIRGQAAARLAHAGRLAELAAADARKADALQETLLRQLLALTPDATNFELPDHKLTSRRSTAVELDVEPMDLPEAFLRTKTTISPDKTALAAALKAGQTIDGAHLVERRSWKIG
jgi:hypothetical protein